MPADASDGLADVLDDLLEGAEPSTSTSEEDL